MYNKSKKECKEIYKEICDLPIAEFYEKTVFDGTVEHIELPEWYSKALGLSKCEHCLRSCKTRGSFHFMNFKCLNKIKNSTLISAFKCFTDFIYIKENSVHQTFKLKIVYEKDKIEVPTKLIKLDGLYKLIIKEKALNFFRIHNVFLETEYNLDFLESIFNIDLKEIISKYIIQDTEIAWLEHNVLEVDSPLYGTQGFRYSNIYYR